MTEAIVSLKHVDKSYSRGKQSIEVLQDLNLDIAKGDFVALMGPSGSGKTTLLNLIGGLDTPTSGEITVAGQRLDQLRSGALARWRSTHVGFVFQFYNLMPMLSAQRNVELPLLLTNLSSAQRRRTPWPRSPWLAWRTAPNTSPVSCRAVKHNAWRLRGPWWPTPPCWSATSPPATSTASRPTTCCICCRCSTANTARAS